ncbi:DNA (cytosine-5-)-methyltransferase [Campylobacter sp. RM12647]|uniref:DNA (cytosine-5-)-methyltransferase n=1 Tax=Campylobacter sp. RM12647 TaxID=2735737 RepID=UPI001D2F098A|nr:DNA (cytosine-5-)-methyltransferase [Campylobacter sp. RM12647]
MNIAGFFAGVGGIELGFKNAGFNIIYANEIDKNAALTYVYNHKHKLVVEDIAKLNDIPNIDMIVAGFPCQAFSIAGYQKGFNDERGNVFFTLAKIIKDKKPSVVFLENVKNLKSHDSGKTYETIFSTLNNMGYYVTSSVLNACEYANTPQNRERIYIVGFLNKTAFDNFSFPSKEKLNKKISDIVDFDKKVDDKYYYSDKNCKNYEMVKNGVINRDTIYQYRRIYIRENKNNLCPTLTANMGTGGHNVPLVLTKYGIRKLTPKECFMFQGFPKDFKLPNIADSHLYKQAGNSVVVPMIEKIAQNIKLAIYSNNKEKL